MIGKVVLVTGGTGKIGSAICTKLAELKAHVIVLGRSKEKCEKTVGEIIRKTNNPNVESAIVDLSSYVGIKKFSEEFKAKHKQLHVLINNAAIVPKTREISTEGIELQFAVNVMSYFWMTRELRDILITSAPSRIINVASNYAGDFRADDLQFQIRDYDKTAAYRQSKQANRMLTVFEAERLKSFSVTVNSCHPGVVSSNVSHGLGFGGWETPEKGAETPVWLATDDEVQNVTGKLFSAKKESTDRFAKKTSEIEALYGYCEELTKQMCNL